MDESSPVEDIGIEEFETEARAWVESNLEPHPNTFSGDISRLTPELIAQNRALQQRLYVAGYSGITIPIEYGGRGLPLEYDAAFRRAAVGYALPDFGTSSVTTWRVCVPTLLSHGRPELLKRIIPKVLQGEALICQFFSEPSSGSDLAGARARAVRDGEEWVLDGQKTWSTFAQVADWGLCLARSNWDVSKHRGLSWFLVPCRTEGIEIRPIRQITGVSSFCDVFLDGVRVPDAHRVGDVDDGWRIAQTMLVLERGALRTAVSSSIPAPAPLPDDEVRQAEAVSSLSPAASHQALGRLQCIEYVGQALQWRLAEKSRLGRMTTGEAAYGKLFRGTYRPIRAQLLVELGGAAALTWSDDDPEAGPSLVFDYLDGRHSSIAGGTNEVQRNGISEQVLGMPREPSYDTGRPYREVIAEVTRSTTERTDRRDQN